MDCVYCGDPADSIDHVPPRSFRSFITADEQLKEKFPFQEVAACRECNSTLGARALWTLPERKDFVKEHLRRKYKKYLNLPRWEEEEYEDFGYMLRTDLQRSEVVQEWIKRRLKH